MRGARRRRAARAVGARRRGRRTAAVCRPRARTSPRGPATRVDQCSCAFRHGLVPRSRTSVTFPVPDLGTIQSSHVLERRSRGSFFLKIARSLLASHTRCFQPLSKPQLLEFRRRSGASMPSSTVSNASSTRHRPGSLFSRGDPRFQLSCVEKSWSKKGPLFDRLSRRLVWFSRARGLDQNPTVYIKVLL